MDSYVVIAGDNPAYFELSDHSPYIPIGLNMIAPSAATSGDEAKGMAEVEGWMKTLSENGGNYIRIWLSIPFWNMEHERAREYDKAKVARVDHLLELARKYGIRVKMTIEHFRGLTAEETKQTWALKSIYHKSHGGPLNSIRQYITSPAGHELFLKKLDFYQKRYADNPAIFGWELWNEMNAVHIPIDSAFFNWNKKMLAALKDRFPKNLTMQSLGSFDDPKVRDTYQTLMKMPGNEVAQIHRYLDLGAPMEICHAPVDILCADAVRELLSYKNTKPSLLAETGAVEPQHSGPSQFYPLDSAGIILHDALFAPFFSGAAGAGMIWHWDQYVAPNNLWYHFNRFAQVVEGLNPVTEQLTPLFYETKDLRIYALKGKKVLLLWCRDKQNTWETELKNRQKPRSLDHSALDLNQFIDPANLESLRSFDPWKNQWQDLNAAKPQLELPNFQRSIVIKGLMK